MDDRGQNWGNGRRSCRDNGRANVEKLSFFSLFPCHRRSAELNRRPSNCGKRRTAKLESKAITRRSTRPTARSTRANGNTIRSTVREALLDRNRARRSPDLGKGTYLWKSTGDVYEGDFANDKRNGFGTLTVKTVDGKSQRQYAGGWKNDKRHVCSLERDRRSLSLCSFV